MIDKDEVLRYLGIQNGLPDPQTLSDVFEISAELERTLSGRWVYEMFKIESRTSEGVWLENCPVVLRGHDIATLLAPCDFVYLMACTLGQKAEHLISLKSHLSASMGLIADACASALIEAWCDQCEAEIRSRAGGALTFRYSPGYGDLPLQVQKPILEVLVAHKRIGLALNDSFLLTPRKSVVAVLGVLRPAVLLAVSDNAMGPETEINLKEAVPHRCGYSNCTLCPLNETCTFKK